MIFFENMPLLVDKSVCVNDKYGDQDSKKDDSTNVFGNQFITLSEEISNKYKTDSPGNSTNNIVKQKFPKWDI